MIDAFLFGLALGVGGTLGLVFVAYFMLARWIVS